MKIIFLKEKKKIRIKTKKINLEKKIVQKIDKVIFNEFHINI